jgi:hypothetical protein
MSELKQMANRQEPEELYVLWTTADREVALKMVFMYTTNSKLKGWWNKVNLIIWGPSAKLLSEDLTLQDHIFQMKHVGVKLFACKACADSYGVAPALETLGIEVKYMGQPLTDLLKSGKTLITI